MDQYETILAQMKSNKLGLNRKSIALRMIITPSIARKMIDRSRLNRNIRSALLRRIINDIKSGNWRVTGESIIFDDECYLTDGQHRLLACIEAGLSIESYIVFGGIDADAMLYTDIGAGRTPGDALTILARPDGNAIAATLRWIYRYQTNTMAYNITNLPRNELISMLDKCPTINESILIGKRCNKFLTPSMASALHYLMAQFDRDLANQFFSEITTGAYSNTSPVFILREKLVTNQLRTAKYPDYIVAAWTIKAWNYTRDGKSVKIINWLLNSPSRMEVFPAIR